MNNLQQFKEFREELLNKNDKKSFAFKLFNYYSFFHDEIDPPTLEQPFNNNIEFLQRYCNTVLNSLKRAYLKENPNKDNFKFLKNIDSMKHNLKITKFICTHSICKQMNDYLKFLWRHYVWI